MAASAPSLIRRVFIAFSSFRRVLKDPDFAAGVRALAKESATAAPAMPLARAPDDAALLLLGLLQKEGRLIDFLQDDIQTCPDEQVGAAARIVHQGCRRVLADHLPIVPIRQESEGSRLTLIPGFDSSQIRPTGQVVGDPPFTGTLVHRGWKVAETRLPKVAPTRDLRILAPAEVEL